MELPEVGSKWVAKVDRPEMAGVSKGDVVVYIGIDGDGDLLYHDGLSTWHGGPDKWAEHFEPYKEDRRGYETKKPPAESTAEGYTPKDIKEPSGKIASDGGSSAYYDFPEGCNTLNDLIEYKGMSFAQGNIFKAAYRLGNKEGITLEYDLKKIKYYADRMLAQIGETK